MLARPVADRSAGAGQPGEKMKRTALPEIDFQSFKEAS
jgi:hypothetical protein